MVLPVYHRIVQMCPTPAALLANRSWVQELLKSLGLKWRSNSLIKMAKQIQETYGGSVPESAWQLRQLPGVSDYIAGAVLCFATGSKEIILDTNIVRVVGRLRGLPISDSSRRSREYRDVLDDMLPLRGSREFYFAIIDLAAVVCRPRNPLCGECPVNQICEFATGQPISRVAKAPRRSRICGTGSTSLNG